MAGMLVELIGNAGIVAPEQYGPAGATVGVTFGVMLIVREAVVAHWPASGVKV